MKTFLNTVILLLVLLVNGCVTSSTPQLLQYSMEVNKIMEGGTVLPDYKYYYTVPQDKPDAIIAIHKDYEFQKSVHWFEVKDMTEKQLRDWNLVIDNDRRVWLTYNGAYILTPDGKRAGIYYSKYSFTVIKYPTPNQIVIYKPDPTPEERRRVSQLGSY